MKSFLRRYGEKLGGTNKKLAEILRSSNIKYLEHYSRDSDCTLR